MLTLEAARRYAAAIVEEVGPDFIYVPALEQDLPTCVYAPYPFLRAQGKNLPEIPEDDPRQTTGCLVGRILDAAGETSHLEESVPLEADVGDLNIDFPTLFANDGVVSFLSLIQEKQDSGFTWADSVAIAEERYQIR